MGKGEEVGGFGAKRPQASKLCRSNLLNSFELSPWRLTGLSLKSGDIKRVGGPGQVSSCCVPLIVRRNHGP